jgi:hypothetical protein
MQPFYKIVLTSFLVFFSMTAPAQDYTLFRSDKSYLYKDSSEFYSVQFDTIEAAGPDTVMYVYVDTAFNTSYLKSLANKKIIKSEKRGAFTFFNKTGDTILIETKTPLAGSWKMYTYANGGYLRATVSSLGEVALFYGMDSVKNILIERLDAADNLMPDTFPQLQISKTHGLIRTPFFTEFPLKKATADLAGAENPEEGITNLTPADIFNFDIGDEFHYYAHTYYYHMVNTYTWTMKKVTDKRVTKDSIFYTYAIVRKTNNISWDSYPGVVSTNLAAAVEAEGKSLMDQETSIAIQHPLKFPAALGDTYHFTSRMFSPDTSYKRFTKFISSFTNFSRVITDNLYGEGIGLISKHTTDYTNPMNPPVDEVTLLYFKKSNQTWGAPLQIDTLIKPAATTGTAVDWVRPLITNEEFIYNGNEVVNFTMYTTGGITLYASTKLQGPISIPLSNLPASLYFYTLEVNGRNFTGKFEHAK